MNALESLVIASFVRGLSVRDVEAALAKAPGDQAAISRSTVSAIRGQIKDEYQTRARRRPGRRETGLPIPGCFLLRIHPGSPAEPVLATWGITTDGKPAFIGLAPGTGESFDTWKDFLATGPKLVEVIDARIGDLAAKYQGIYPAAAKVLLTDREGLNAYLRFPAEHHHRIRHSDFVERTFGETRRRVRVVGRRPGETSCLTVVWAVLDRASRGWRGLTMTADGLRLLQDLRRSLIKLPPTAATHGHHRRACRRSRTASTVA